MTYLEKVKEKIAKATTEELAEILTFTCSHCSDFSILFDRHPCTPQCTEKLVKWLNSEVE